ncbi:uncharacterized protein LOC121690310 [Alosa sapidissima]|uniref:uncharacterized protein LOC121690310 n=1 Tax=Alosa sapidissima TaxID=34773 RepID=UPI001C0809EB|nr:uncharacterized protein LOC121690310 [Alosa sapidissima]
MEIRWFRGTDCIYLYKNGQVTVSEDYEGRVSLNTQRLQRGDVSLRLRESRESDTGRYQCQVISGEHVVGTRIGLRYDGGRGVIYRMHCTSIDLVRLKMEESVRTLVNQTAKEMGRRLSSKKMEGNEQPEGRDKKRADSGSKNRKNTIKQQSKEHMTKQEREKETEDMERELQDLRTQLQEQERELEERNKQLEERDKQLEERDKQLEDRDKQLEDRDKQLEEIIKQLEERDEMLDVTCLRRARSKDQFIEFRGNHLLPPAVTGWRSEPVSLCAGIHDQDHIWKRWSMAEHLIFRRESPVPPVSPAVSELRLVLLGGSTAGKRAAGNTILGTNTLTHTSTETQHSESRQGEVAGRRVTMVDTPDWFCSGLSEKDMRQDVGLCVRLSAPGPHAFLLLIPVEPSEGEERRMLEKMEDIFGEGCWGHTLILFTHAEGLRERSVEELLQTGSQELQQLVEKCGNRCHLLNVKDRPDDTKITQLLEKIE